MGYVIEYPGNSWKNPKKGRLWVPVCAVLCALALVGLIWKDSRYYIQRLLFPGDAAAALAELERLAENLQSGTPLGQALEVFCAGVVSR